MTALNTHPGEKAHAPRRHPRRRVRFSGEVHLGPLVASLATLLVIAWVVSFQHEHSRLYDTAPDRPAVVAAAQP